LNVKAENLAEVFEVSAEAMTEGALEEAAKEVPKKGLVVLDGSHRSVDVLNALVTLWKASPREVSVYLGERTSAPVARRLLNYGYMVVQERPSVELGVADGVLVKGIPGAAAEDVLVVGEACFDPAYGFRGSATALCEAFGLAGDAIKRWDGVPASGLDAAPAWFAARVAEEMGNPLCVEYIRGKGGISAAFSGAPAEAHASAVKFLNERRSFAARKAKLLVVSPGGSEFDSTLHDSFMALGNCADVMEEDAEVLLLAEAAAGLGSNALRAYVDTGAKPEGLGHLSGYEDLMFMKWIKGRARVHVVSTLPRTIVEKKLGFGCHASAKQAFEEVESRHGWRLKATVVKDACLIRLRTSQ